MTRLCDLRFLPLAAALVLGGSLSAQAQGRVGILECRVAAGVGMIITSSRALDCQFLPEYSRRPERYVGTVNRFGLDAGFTEAGVLSWAVLAPAMLPGPGALQGTYGGLGAGATFGFGFGANGLTGGPNQSINLQPVSLQGQTGVNITAGISQITLEYVPSGPARRKYRRARSSARY